ncbi:MAG: hypothetical protein ABI480_14810 [Chitinophagaceae bacterium]
MKSKRIRRNIIKTRRTVRDVTSLNEGPWRWAMGIETGIAVGIPVALFMFLGRQSYGLIAALGAYVIMYAGSRTLF